VRWPCCASHIGASSVTKELESLMNSSNFRTKLSFPKQPGQNPTRNEVVRDNSAVTSSCTGEGSRREHGRRVERIISPSDRVSGRERGLSALATRSKRWPNGPRGR
jgi:hypothetical protein